MSIFILRGSVGDPGMIIVQTTGRQVKPTKPVLFFLFSDIIFFNRRTHHCHVDSYTHDSSRVGFFISSIDLSIILESYNKLFINQLLLLYREILSPRLQTNRHRPQYFSYTDLNISLTQTSIFLCAIPVTVE